ncbi:MAG: hypothetical protein MMC33_002371 [Icmadophila ericetorum]|nr:hypothetical protein [Icmadophila ericetorum]
MQVWCLHDRGFEDGVLVLENKLILWMDEAVLPRVVKKGTKTKPSAAASKGKRRRIVDRPAAMLVGEEGAVEGEVIAETAGVEGEGSSASEAEVCIKAETVEAVSAICNLYSRQVIEGHNKYPNPRGSAFKGKMKAIRKRHAAKNVGRLRGSTGQQHHRWRERRAAGAVHGNHAV